VARSACCRASCRLRRILRPHRETPGDSQDGPHRPVRVPASYVLVVRSPKRENVFRVWQRSLLSKLRFRTDCLGRQAPAPQGSFRAKACPKAALGNDFPAFSSRCASVRPTPAIWTASGQHGRPGPEPRSGPLGNQGLFPVQEPPGQ
jgi:hypothetical protein